jgi:hypothetical protein
MIDAEVGQAGRRSRPRPRVEALIGAGLAVIFAAAVAAAASPAPEASGDLDASPPGGAGDRFLPGDAFGHFGPFDGLPFGGRLDHFGFGGIAISAVDGEQVSLATVDGWTRTITVTADTDITKGGEDAALADLEVGDQVRFRQTRNDDGTFSIAALAVVLPRIAGEVTAVDGSTITIDLRDGSTGMINIGPDTELRVAGEDGADASDIEVGMMIIAAGERNADGSIDAVRAVAGERLRGWHGPKLDRDSTDDGTDDNGSPEPDDSTDG